MPSKYWIKLYHEILDDPKMGMMPEILFARCIKLFLLAGDHEQGGKLPTIPDIAWRLRIPEEEIESDLIELQRMGIAAQSSGVWQITKWKHRQRTMSSTERTQLWRANQKMREYQDEGPADVTFRDESGTTRPTEVEEEVEADVEVDKEAAAKRDFLKTTGIGNPEQPTQNTLVAVKSFSLAQSVPNTM